MIFADGNSSGQFQTLVEKCEEGNDNSLWDVAGEVVLTLLLELGFIQPGLA